MREVVASVNLTLDGVMQAPGGPEEDRSGGFTLGGWSVNYWDHVMGELIAEVVGDDFDLLLGRKTYEIFAAHWPYAGEDDAMAVKLNEVTKYLVSNTIDQPEWATTILLTGDAAESVAQLKTEDGPELQVHGSWQLLQTLQQHGLVDEYRLLIFPVIAGSGKRLWVDGTPPTGLDLTSHRLSSTGVAIATYRRGGPIDLGSFAFEEPTPAEVRRRERLRGAPSDGL